MFENVLFQNHIVSTLKKEIHDGSLPQSLLFYGESFSGKLTTALELARVLNCNEGGDWGCKCKNCYQNLNMQHPYLLIAGTRYFMQEIKQSSEFLIKERSKASQFVFIRNVRKLIKRYSEDLWDKEDTKYKKSISSLNKIDDVIHLIDPKEDLPNDKKLQTIIKKILTECSKLSNDLPNGNIPINQIRNISTWVRRSVSNHKKVVILERAELMQDSSRNSLLKILEEPPSDTYFILISEKKSTVLPTILSRVRAYGFKAREVKEQKLILEKLYKDNKNCNTIKDYFFTYSDYEGDTFSDLVTTYFQMCFEGNSSFNDALPTKIEGDYFLRFLEILTDRLKENFKNNKSITLSQLEGINRSIKDKIIKLTFYNQNSMLLLETLFYEIKRIICA